MCSRVDFSQVGNAAYQDKYHPKYDVVSLVGYLIGVEKRIFENEHEPMVIEIFDKLEKDRCARRIRNLCRVRTAFIKNYNKIQTEFRLNFRSINSVPDLIPADALAQLATDGINLHLKKPSIDTYLTTINREISNNINNCKNLFPEWLNWDYVKTVFLMPDGLKPAGIYNARTEYREEWDKFPYLAYLNWPAKADGNILYCDDKFIKKLYEINNDYFGDRSLLRDVGNIALDSINSFVAEAEKIIMVVDCENSDPIKLSAALSCLSKTGAISKVKKIFLFDSEYTTSSWDVMSKDWSIISTFGNYEIDHMVVKRINEKKSQVDMTLAAVTCKEVYGNGVDSVILVSSDSDYWALMQNLKDARFLVLVEHKKCGQGIKNAFDSQNIPYCYLDDFNTSDSYNIKIRALVKHIQKVIDSQVEMNAKQMLDSAIVSTYVEMTPQERDSFYNKYLAKMRVEISDEGDIRIRLGE